MPPPHIDYAYPTGALPGGLIEITGVELGPSPLSNLLPTALVGESPAHLTLSRSTRAIVQVPEGAIPSDLTIMRDGLTSNAVPLRIAVPLVETVNPVANPTVDADGNIYVMFSGPRGEKVDVSIYKIARDFQVRPFIRDLLNISALAFGPDGFLYASSRAEGVVYRISLDGEVSTYAEGMGVATGIAFDHEGNLFVGDRTGTIFKIAPGPDGTAGETFVFATLEPSVAAYHLAFCDDGTLLVTAPTTASHDVIHCISPSGEPGIFYRGLSRPQGMAVDAAGNVYVAASLHGRRGIVCIDGDHNARLSISGDDLVGLCFLDDGIAALATRTAVFHVELGVQGRALIPR